MKITFLLPVVNMSGGIRVAVIHAQNLAKRGHEITLVSPAPVKLGFGKQVRQFLKTGKFQKWEKTPKSHIDETGLRHIVVTHSGPVSVHDIPPSDVVVATWWETAEWLMTWPASCGAKVYFIQGHETFDYLPEGRVKKTYRSDLHKITISGWLHDLMMTEYHANQCDLVPNAVDHSQFNAPIRTKKSTPSIGFLYNSTGLKGLDVSLAVVERLFKRYENLEVIAFGPKFDPKFPLNRRVKLFESPAQSEIKNIYASCDVWLSTSRNEGFGLTAMEAMACRTPVVSTKTGWSAEAIVNGENGYIEEIDDVDGLCNSTARILDLSNSDWQKVSKCAFDTVKNNNWEASSELFEKSLLRAHAAHNNFARH